MDMSGKSAASGNNENNILCSFLEELQICSHKDLWSIISPKMLFKYYLADATAIFSSFVHAELNCLNKVFMEYTGQFILKSSDTKAVKVNKICTKFGDMSVMQWQHSNNKSQNAKSLKDICFKIVSSGSVPKTIIAVSVACIKCTLEINKWQNSATIPVVTYIHHKKEKYKFFSFPEFSEKVNNQNLEH